LAFHEVESRSFLILFILFVVAVELNEMHHLNAWEIMFMVYSLGFSLEKVAAMQEHGIRGNVLHATRASSVEYASSLLYGYLGA
jgi:hypothetical protein